MKHSHLNLYDVLLAFWCSLSGGKYYETNNRQLEKMEEFVTKGWKKAPGVSFTFKPSRGVLDTSLS